MKKIISIMIVFTLMLAMIHVNVNANQKMIGTSIDEIRNGNLIVTILEKDKHTNQSSELNGFNVSLVALDHSHRVAAHVEKRSGFQYKITYDENALIKGKTYTQVITKANESKQFWVGKPFQASFGYIKNERLYLLGLKDVSHSLVIGSAIDTIESGRLLATVRYVDKTSKATFAINDFSVRLVATNTNHSVTTTVRHLSKDRFEILFDQNALYKGVVYTPEIVKGKVITRFWTGLTYHDKTGYVSNARLYLNGVKDVSNETFIGTSIDEIRANRLRVTVRNVNRITNVSDPIGDFGVRLVATNANHSVTATVRHLSKDRYEVLFDQNALLKGSVYTPEVIKGNVTTRFWTGLHYRSQLGYVADARLFIFGQATPQDYFTLGTSVDAIQDEMIRATIVYTNKVNRYRMPVTHFTVKLVSTDNTETVSTNVKHVSGHQYIIQYQKNDLMKGKTYTPVVIIGKNVDQFWTGLTYRSTIGYVAHSRLYLNGVKEEVVVDKTPILRALALLTRNVDTSDKTPNSVVAYQYLNSPLMIQANGLKLEAEAFMRQPNVTKQQVDAMVSRIHALALKFDEAERLLVLKADQTNLRQAITLLNTEIQQEPDLNEKTNESIAQYRQALENAKTVLSNLRSVLDDENISQNEVNAKEIEVRNTLSALQTAKQQLRNIKKQVVGKAIALRHVEDAFLYRMNEEKALTKIFALEGVFTDYHHYKVKAYLPDAKKYVWLDVENVQDRGTNIEVEARFPTVRNETSGGLFTLLVNKTTQPHANVFTSFKALVDAMRQRPDGNFVIGKNLTASEVSMSTNALAYVENFTGTLTSANGAVYTIYDLEKPLFNVTNHATISNIHLEDIRITITSAEELGSLVNHADNHTTIRNVSGKGSVIGSDHVGGLVGILDNNSTMENVAFEGKVSSIRSAGGLVSNITRGSNVNKAFADIVIYAKPLDVDRVGGLVAQINENGTLENAYVKGIVQSHGDINARVGGVIGGIYTPAGTLQPDGTVLPKKDLGKVENVYSFVNVTNGKLFIGNMEEMINNNNKTMLHNFAVEGLTGTDLPHPSLSRIAKNTAENAVASFYQKPVLQFNEAQRYETALSSSPSFIQGNEIVYTNMKKLLPFYDVDTVVKEANKIPQGHVLKTKNIKAINYYADNHIVKQFAVEKNNINQLELDFGDEIVKYTLTNPMPFKETGIMEYTITNTNTIFTPHQIVTDYGNILTESLSGIQNLPYNDQLFNQHKLSGWIQKEKDKVLGRMYLKDNFGFVKNNVVTYTQGLLDDLDLGTYHQGMLNAYVKHQLASQQKALLVGLTYMHRWYTFSNMFERLLFNLDSFNGNRNSLDLVLTIGNSSTKVLNASDTEKTYTQIVANFTNIPSVLSLMENSFRMLPNGATDINDWIKKTTSAYITQARSTHPKAKNHTIFERLSRVEYQNMLLPLLTVKKEHVYMLMTSNNTVFGIFDRYNDYSTNDHRFAVKNTQVKKDLDKTAVKIQEFFDVWYRLLNEVSQDRLSNTVMQVYDTVSTSRDGDHVRTYSDEYGDYAFESVKAFMGPIGKYKEKYAAAFAGVENNIPYVYFSDYSLIHGLSTLTHEHTHNLDKIVMFNNFYRRSGHGPESFALGMFQSPEAGSVDLGINLIFDVDRSNNYLLTHNRNPRRFSNINDLKVYMERVFDVLYTLDLAEAEIMIEKGSSFIRNHYHEIVPLVYDGPQTVVGPRHNEDIVRNINHEVRTPTSIDDLIDQNIVSGIINDQVYGNDNYYTVNMFASHFGILENRLGASGGLTFRRVAFELLADKGYYEGMVPYVSMQIFYEATNKEHYHGDNNLHSDSYILSKIYPNNEYPTFKDFRKAMFRKRAAKKDNIRSVQFFGVGSQKNNYITLQSYTQLKNLIRQAIDEGGNNYLENLKRRIFNGYILKTDEFRTSIYNQ